MKIKKSWYQLKNERCPICNADLINNLFEEGVSNCVCGFRINEVVKISLVKRDSE